MDYYNEERLHAALSYLPPVEYLRGNPGARLEERRRKLAQARTTRRERNRELLKEAAASEEGLSLSLCAQGKQPKHEARPDPPAEDQAPYLVTSRGAQAALQQSLILRQGNQDFAPE